MFRVVPIAALLAGCSPLWIHRPVVTETPTQTIVECNSSRVVPTIDLAITAASIAGAVAYGVSDHPQTDVGMPPHVFLTLTAIGFGISSLIGYWRTGTCRETKADYAPYSALSGVRRSSTGMTFLPVTMPM